MDLKTTTHSNLISLFAGHPVAANMLMAIVVLSGIWGAWKLNTQLFPTFNLLYVSVQVEWSGASTEDVEYLVTNPLERSLRSLDGLKQLTSTSREGFSDILLEFREGTDIATAVGRVKQLIDQVKDLPEKAEKPQVKHIINYEPVARLVVSGHVARSELRYLVRQFERELIDRGIERIDIVGLPEEEISIQVSSAMLRDLNMSLDQLGRSIALRTQDVPLGVVGRTDTSRQLRFVDQRRRALQFEDLVVKAEDAGAPIELGDFASIERRHRDTQVTAFSGDSLAVEMHLFRSESGDALESASILQRWLEETRRSLPPSIALVTYDNQWEQIKQRRNLLIENGTFGLILVILALVIFVDWRTASWITLGIPISLMATLSILYMMGESINMVSMFAMIMAIGIIVDDAIVVAENATSNFENGDEPFTAVLTAAYRMFPVVVSSSLTTVAAFIPLFVIGGAIGSILFSLPLVMISVIVASLIECFLILPRHLVGSFQSIEKIKPGSIRSRTHRAGQQVMSERIRPFVAGVVEQRKFLYAIVGTFLMISIGLVFSGRLPFQFFPTAEGNTLIANVEFVAGTPRATVKDYADHIESALHEATVALDEDVVVTSVKRVGMVENNNMLDGKSGDRYASVIVELTDPDSRVTRNRQIIEAWSEKLHSVPSLENLTVMEKYKGLPEQEISIRVYGGNIQNVKRSSDLVKEILFSTTGVSNIQDNMPYGREHMILKLTPVGEALDLSAAAVGDQIRAAYDGYFVKELSDGADGVEVRVVLSDHERDKLTSLDRFEIFLPDGSKTLLSNIVAIQMKRGFETVRHESGRLALTITADVDSGVAYANDIVYKLKESLPEIGERFATDFDFGGRQKQQAEVFEDIGYGVILALCFIYIIMAWVMESYSWPFVVFAVIPFVLLGAIWGHLVMGVDVTVFSYFGFFGLAGVAINDIIILLSRYKELRKQGGSIEDCVIAAAISRFRAVFLTTLTTVVGLIPLLFETSLQAQFLIPLAITLVFGLSFSGVLTILLVPALLYDFERSLLKNTAIIPILDKKPG